ncbi:MAG: hypothetical protein ACSHYA_08820 [Opitutaceae bacterium]
MRYKYTKDRRSTSGSALIISIIFAAVITIGLTSLLSLMMTDWKHTARSSAQEAAFNLAECGVDEAAWAFLEYGTDDQKWIDAGWSEDPSNQSFWFKEWSLSDISGNFTLDENREGIYRVIVEKTTSSTINIVSQGIVRGGASVPTDFEVARVIETQFTSTNPFTKGLIARGSVTFNGRPFFDSYDSRQFPYSYLFGVNSGNDVTVGSASDNLANLGFGNATILGDIATGASNDGSDPSGKASVSGDVIWDFSMTFPRFTNPTSNGTSRMP